MHPMPTINEPQIQPTTIQYPLGNINPVDRKTPLFSLDSYLEIMKTILKVMIYLRSPTTIENWLV